MRERYDTKCKHEAMAAGTSGKIFNIPRNSYHLGSFIQKTSPWEVRQ